MINFDTLPNDGDPGLLISSIDHTRRQHDSEWMLNTMRRISGCDAVLWGDNVIGFGRYHYLYKTGREGKWPILAFSPSLQNISIHIMPGLANYKELINKIGRVKHDENTLILHKLSDISKPALENFLETAFEDIRESQDCS